MAQWRLRTPGTFPLVWHTVMSHPPGEYILNCYDDWDKAKHDQEMWRLFQFSLRNNSNHPTCALVDNGLSRRSKVKWDTFTEKWALYIVVAEAKSSRWLDVQVVEKPIDRSR